MGRSRDVWRIQPGDVAHQRHEQSLQVADELGRDSGSPVATYVNGRYSIGALNNQATTSTTFSVPNADPQKIVVWSSNANVTATMTKAGSSSLSATSQSATHLAGAVSSATTNGSGTWTLSITNASGATASWTIAVVLSYSRFQSDWQTARRGDIMQMYIGGSANPRNSSTPHTAFVQTDYNENGTTTCSGDPMSQTNTQGCNWLDSNWSPDHDGKVRAHNMSLDKAIKIATCQPAYGFTVYRLN